ncbi:hypothetical protein Tco_0028367, partial [Tanacetum coccineum]
MAPLPPRDQRHPWLRSVNRVHVLNFTGLTEEMRHTLASRLRMVYTGDDKHELFTSHAWRRLFEIRGPLVREFILEFLNTCRMSNTEMGLDVADTLCSVRVIHDKGDLRDYWIEISSDKDFLGLTPSYVYIRDPVRRLCHMMISCSISGRGQPTEKVTGIDLFFRSMDQGTINVPYLLAQYLFRHAEGRKSGAKMSGGYFIGRLADHFGLVSDEGLMGLSMIARVLPVAAVGAPKVVEGDPAVDGGVPVPVQAPQPLPAPARTIAQ